MYTLGLMACTNTQSSISAPSTSILTENENVFANGSAYFVTYNDENLTESEFRQHDEYKKNQSAFDTINITAAWAKGSSGEGVVIGIIDTEVYNGPEFVGKNLTHISAIEFDSGDTHYTLQMDPSKLYNRFSHGSAVAGIAAANFDALGQSSTNETDADYLADNGIVGVAYGASVVDTPGLTIDCAQSGCVYAAASSNLPSDTFVLNQTTNDYFQAIVQATLDADAKFVNLSWGYKTTLAAISDAGFQTPASVADNLSGMIEAMAQTNTTKTEQSVFVISAGNSFKKWREDGTIENYADDPILLAELPLLDDKLQGLVIAAVALNDSNDRDELASYSNRCGVAQEFCVAAPGTVYSSSVRGALSIDEDGNYRPIESENITHAWKKIKGTSFAAPIITGSLAVIYDYFNGTISPRESALTIVKFCR